MTKKSKFKFTDLTNTKSIRPDITIGVQPRKHFNRPNCQGQLDYLFAFDRQGTSSAHSFFWKVVIVGKGIQILTPISFEDKTGLKSFYRSIEKISTEHFPEYRFNIISKALLRKLHLIKNNLVVPKQSEELKTYLPK